MLGQVGVATGSTVDDQGGMCWNGGEADSGWSSCAIEIGAPAKDGGLAACRAVHGARTEEVDSGEGWPCELESSRTAAALGDNRDIVPRL